MACPTTSTGSPSSLRQTCPTACGSCWRTCCATRTASRSPRTRSRRCSTGARRNRSPRAVDLHAGPGVPARHQRGAHAGGPGRDARRHCRARRRPRPGQPRHPRRAGGRPLGDRRRIRHAGRVRPQRRDRVRPQRRAIPLPQVGAAVAAELRGRPAGYRDHAPGQRRVPVPRRHGRQGLGLSRRVPGHRLAHHDGQRARCARLGHRRDRGRGRHARPVPVDAAPTGRRRPAARSPTGGHHRDRPRPHGHRADAPPWRRRQVRRVLRTRRHRDHARRSRHHQQHEPRVRLDLRLLPRRRRDAAVPALHRAQRRSGSRWSRRTPRSRACGTSPDRPRRYTEHVELDLSTVVPSLAGPRRPQDRVPLDRVPMRSASRWRHTRPRRGEHRRRLLGRRGVRGVVPGERRSRDRRRTTRRGAAGTGPHSTRAPEPAQRTSPRHPRRGGARDRPRRGRHRRDHLVHQHLQPVGDGGRRAAGAERGAPRPALASPGSRPASRPAPGSSPTTSTRPGSPHTWRSSASTWPGTAA